LLIAEDATFLKKAVALAFEGHTTRHRLAYRAATDALDAFFREQCGYDHRRMHARLELQLTINAGTAEEVQKDLDAINEQLKSMIKKNSTIYCVTTVDRDFVLGWKQCELYVQGKINKLIQTILKMY
jgi:hypothetical protein